MSNPVQPIERPPSLGFTVNAPAAAVAEIATAMATQGPGPLPATLSLAPGGNGLVLYAMRGGHDYTEIRLPSHVARELGCVPDKPGDVPIDPTEWNATVQQTIVGWMRSKVGLAFDRRKV